MALRRQPPSKCNQAAMTRSVLPVGTACSGMVSRQTDARQQRVWCGTPSGIGNDAAIVTQPPKCPSGRRERVWRRKLSAIPVLISGIVTILRRVCRNPCGQDPPAPHHLGKWHSTAPRADDLLHQVIDSPAGSRPLDTPDRGGTAAGRVPGHTVSGGREPPPPALLEPYVTVSRHTAPAVRRWVEARRCQ